MTISGRSAAAGLGKMLPRLRIGPGHLIAAIAAEIAVREVVNRMILWFNGLQQVRQCLPFPMSTYGATGTLTTCLTNQVNERSIANMFTDTIVAGNYYRMLSPVIRIVATQRRRDEVATFIGTGAAVGSVKARPFAEPPGWAGIHNPSQVLAPPGRVPAVTRPWPVWAGPRPKALEGPSPVPHSEPDEDVGTKPWEWAWSPTGTTFPGSSVKPVSRPVSRPVTQVRAVPVAGTREVKVGANSSAAQLFYSLMRARELVSEVEDMWEVLYQSLPNSTRKAYGGNQVSNSQMLRALWDNWDRVDPMHFLENLVANQIEDEIIGRTWIKYRAQLRNIVHGDALGSLGPGGNDAFKQYAKSVSALAKHVAKGLRDEVERIDQDARTNELAKDVDRRWRAVLRAAANQ